MLRGIGAQRFVRAAMIPAVALLIALQAQTRELYGPAHRRLHEGGAHNPRGRLQRFRLADLDRGDTWLRWHRLADARSDIACAPPQSGRLARSPSETLGAV